MTLWTIYNSHVFKSTAVSKLLYFSLCLITQRSPASLEQSFLLAWRDRKCRNRYRKEDNKYDNHNCHVLRKVKDKNSLMTCIFHPHILSFRTLIELLLVYNWMAFFCMESTELVLNYPWKLNWRRLFSFLEMTMLMVTTWSVNMNLKW